MVHRLDNKLLLTPDPFKPTDSRLRVIGVFNPGVARLKDEIVMLVRMSEAPVEASDQRVYSPRALFADHKHAIEIDSFKPRKHSRDPRRIFTDDGLERLPYISHLEVVRLSSEGYSVTAIEHHNELLPHNNHEEFGLEDPRITLIDDVYYITYVSVSSKVGISTSLLSTKNFSTFTRHGVIFDLETKDVVIFPEKIGGRYVAYVRPLSKTEMHRTLTLVAYSPDLVHWGEYAHVMESRPGTWDELRIGPGCPPLKTKKGWLTIYHGVHKRSSTDTVGQYCAGAILTDLQDPSRVIARSKEPFLIPEKPFEKSGFVRDVVFPTGLLQDHLNPDRIHIYYGCADTNIAVVTVSLPELINSLEKVN